MNGAERAGAAPDGRRTITTTERDLDEIRAALEGWLAVRVDADRTPDITGMSRPEAGGMSSSSVVFDASWTSGGAPAAGCFVVRMAPEASAMTVFPVYDLVEQFEVMRAVAEHSDVAVPRLRWLERSAEPLGAPFFVMDHVAGQVPQDNPPYVFSGWLLEATPEQRARLQQRSVDVVAKIHEIPDATSRFAFVGPTGDDPLREHVEQQRAYYHWALAGDGVRVPLIEHGFDWLERHWPTSSEPAVFTWGDARIGNIIYRDFEPVGVLDWEMAALGPRELDLGWLIFMHRFFQDLAPLAGLPGLPDFLRRDDVATQYQRATGHSVRELGFYLVYAAIRHAIVMARIKRRMIHFGEDTAPEDPDDFVLHRPSLQAMLEGSYEWA